MTAAHPVDGGTDPGVAPAGSGIRTAARLPFQAITKPIGPVCNLACEYCFYLDKKDLYPGGERFRMPDAVLDRYVHDFVTAQPGPEVTFCWQGGEPTLMGLDFFRRVVDRQREHLPEGWVCHNSLQTNGTLLDDEWGAFLAEHGFLVGISVDGPADVHDAYRVDRSGGATHAAVLGGVDVLRRHGVDFNVLCTVHAANAVRPLDVYRFFRDELRVDWVQLIPIVEPSGEHGVSARSVPPEAWGEFLVAIFDEWVRHDVGAMHVQHFEEALRVAVGYGATLCVHQETCGRALAVEHNGDVYACDHFVDPEHRLGNLLQGSMTEMVESAAQVRFGLDKRDTLPTRCLTCEVRPFCHGGCPKDRFAVPAVGADGTDSEDSTDSAEGADSGRPLNHLCAGYLRFFTHAAPVLGRMADMWRRGVHPSAIMRELAEDEARARRAVGRNEPCPCGSGRKYKYCCLLV